MLYSLPDWESESGCKPLLQAALRAWETTYNTIRPHQALGQRTPAEFLASLGP